MSAEKVDTAAVDDAIENLLSDRVTKYAKRLVGKHHEVDRHKHERAKYLLEEFRKRRIAVAELVRLGRRVEQSDADGALTDSLMNNFRGALSRCEGRGA